MTQPITLVVLSTALDNFKEIRAALTTDNRLQLLAGGNDAEQVQEEIVRLKPSAAIIALGERPDHAIKLIEKLHTECPGTALISAAQSASGDLILRSLRAGAREFLHLPIKSEELKTVFDRITETPIAQVEAPKKRGRMIAVFSSKGGCGTSFIATNLAAANSKPTVLVDLNLQAGDLPLYLGVDPKYSIAEVVENHSRLDEALIMSFVTPCTSTLSLLAAPNRLTLLMKLNRSTFSRCYSGSGNRLITLFWIPSTRSTRSLWPHSINQMKLCWCFLWTFPRFAARKELSRYSTGLDTRERKYGS